MDVDRFWLLIEQSDTPEELHARLTALNDEDLVLFETLYDARFAESYQWDLWGAAYIIHGGCGDDAFDDFRAYLISLGRRIYETALANADSLADVSQFDAEGDEWEDWMSPTMHVVHARTGRWEFAGDGARPVAPDGPGGEEGEEDDLPSRLPRLAARYGWAG